MTDRANSTALLCDAAFSALPILFALKRMGYRVAVCGSRANDPSHAFADLSLVLDYGDQDLLLRTVKDKAIQFLVPGCTDVSYLSCAWVANQLGMPGFDTLESTQIIHRKDRFREFCKIHKFSTPRSVPSMSEVSNLQFPILIKPSDSFSGKGIIKVQCEAELSQGVGRAKSQSGAQFVVFEEFVEGSLYSHSAFLQDGKILADFFVNEFCTVHPYQVNSSHLSLDLDADIVRGLRNWLEALASVLSLANGLVHTQFILNGNGFYLIEVTRRCPGDLYSALIEKSTGFDYAGTYAASFCGLDLAVKQFDQRKRYFSRHTVSVDRDCIFLASSIEIPHAKISYFPLKKTGERLRAAPLDRAGIYFIEHSDAAEMQEFAPRLRNCVTVESPNHV